MLTITITAEGKEDKVYTFPSIGRYEISQEAPKIGSKRISIVYTTESFLNIFSTFFNDYQKLDNNFDSIIININNVSTTINQENLSNVYYIIGNEARSNDEVTETLDFLIDNYEY